MSVGYFCQSSGLHLTVLQFADELTEYIRYAKLQADTRTYLNLQIKLLQHLALVMKMIDEFADGDSNEDEFLQHIHDHCVHTRDQLKSDYPHLID